MNIIDNFKLFCQKRRKLAKYFFYKTCLFRTVSEEMEFKTIKENNLETHSLYKEKAMLAYRKKKSMLNDKQLNYY